MTTLSETPTFNLKAVVQETGIKPDTLRAWERRYGLPQPARTSGGHRLYSQHDIDTLKWLMERQEEGLSISRAVDLWNQLQAEGKDPFWEMGDLDSPAGPPVGIEVGDTLAELRQNWVEACLAYNEHKATYTLEQAFALYAPETVCIEVLQKGLNQIGKLWYEGEATAQQEHFASALALRKLEAMLAAAAPPTRAGRILIGCPPDEEHTFSPLMLSLFMRRRGWDVLYLGANVPLDRLERTIERTQPHLIVLSAQTLHTAGTLFAMARFIHDMDIPLAFGGQVFNVIPDLAERIPGHFLGHNLSDAPTKIEQLLAGPRKTPAVTEPGPEYENALDTFIRTQSHIDSYIWAHADKADVPAVHLSRANRSMGMAIAASLKLGNMNLLGHDLEWVEGLISNHMFPFSAELLGGYLRVYREAVQQQLGSDGDIITEWLDEVIVTNGFGKAES